MKTALVLGSSGFIGGHLVKTLIDDGYNVTGSDIRNVTYGIFKPTTFIQGDLRNYDFVNSLFNSNTKYDEVYQLRIWGVLHI